MIRRLALCKLTYSISLRRERGRFEITTFLIDDIIKLQMSSIFSHHNYHHVFPQDYRASESPWTSNSTKKLIDLFAKMGLVYDRKYVSFWNSYKITKIFRIVSDDVIRKQAMGHGDGKYESKDAMPKWQYTFTLFLSFVIFTGGFPLSLVYL